jgi:predicted RNase H-like nuclease (RuvC/YqgF family)
MANLKSEVLQIRNEMNETKTSMEKTLKSMQNDIKTLNEKCMKQMNESEHLKTLLVAFFDQN